MSSTPETAPLISSATHLDLQPPCDTHTVQEYYQNIAPNLLAVLENIAESGFTSDQVYTQYLLGDIAAFIEQMHTPPCREAVYIYLYAREAMLVHIVAGAYEAYDNLSLAVKFHTLFLDRLRRRIPALTGF